MIQNVQIDVSEFAQEFGIPEDDIKQFTDNVIGDLAVEFSRYWEHEASVLKSTRQEYQNSIYTEKIQDGVYVVGLKGFLPNAVENGLEPFDEKIGFKNSSKVHQKKGGGWYLTIPFRFASSSAIGESVVFSGVLPSKVYEVAKKLPEGKKLNKTNLPTEFRGTKTREKIITKSKTFEEYQHKHSIYEGLQRTKDSKGRGQYNTFRRVSDKSDPSSWIHGGIEEHDLAESAFRKMDFSRSTDSIVNRYINKLVR